MGGVRTTMHPEVSSIAIRSIDASAASETVFRRRARSVARAGGILQDLDFILEACDLVSFLRLLQRVRILVARFLGFAQLPIRVTKMLGDRWIAAGQVDRALELLDGFFVVAFLVVNPAQAIDVKSVFGLDIERGSSW